MKNKFLQAGMVKSVHGKGVTCNSDQMYAIFKVSSVDVEDSNLSGRYFYKYDNFLITNNFYI